MKTLDHYWYSQNPVAWMLLPLSWLFCTVAALRRYLYARGWLESFAVGKPLVIVGNISVGGTGKTPLIIALCEYLMQQGIRPGVVSRGYGASISGVYSVAPDDDAARCGDEPLLIRQRTGCPVVIGSDRVAAAEKLLAEHACDAVLSDDGLQHYRMRRDIEIAVVDAARKFGNGFCLPAGPLREAESRLDSVDMIVHHGSSDDEPRFSLEFENPVNLLSRETRPLVSFSETPVHAVAGIGHPQRFFSQLRDHGLQVIEHAFPDHHAYSADDFLFGNGTPILMTEKDAVKCINLQSIQGMDAVLERCWKLPVSAQLSSQLGPDLVALIQQCQ